MASSLARAIDPSSVSSSSSRLRCPHAKWLPRSFPLSSSPLSLARREGCNTFRREALAKLERQCQREKGRMKAKRHQRESELVSLSLEEARPLSFFFFNLNLDLLPL